MWEITAKGGDKEGKERGDECFLSQQTLEMIRRKNIGEKKTTTSPPLISSPQGRRSADSR